MDLLLSRAIKIIVSQKAKFWCFDFNIVSGFQLSILDFDKNQPEFQKTKLKFVNANTLNRNFKKMNSTKLKAKIKLEESDNEGVD